MPVLIFQIWNSVTFQKLKCWNGKTSKNEICSSESQECLLIFLGWTKQLLGLLGGKI